MDFLSLALGREIDPSISLHFELRLRHMLSRTLRSRAG